MPVVNLPQVISAPTFIPVTVTPTPVWMVNQLITPDALQVEHWAEYEKALADVLLPPNSLRGEALCEWSILGRSTQQVYVWAFCQSPPYSETLPPSIASVPAVIELDQNGMVQGARIPGSGSAYAPDVRSLFPSDIQAQVFAHAIDTTQMEAHINFRREHPEPPLTILAEQPAITPIQ